MMRPTIAATVIWATATVSSIWAQPLTPVDCMMVVDATEKKVGNVVGVEQTSFVLISLHLADGRLVALQVSRGRLLGGTLFFVSDNCSGTPLIEDFGGVLPNVAVQPPGQTLYVKASGTTTQVTAVRSMQGGPPGEDCV